ncbi:uncharacterized protein LOC135844223 [Planococcus citri]|uniref:uncharacterized protein LOC135844223 n=1 Tax=Planococcus citri TaxID=170843 RepID=UPI0031FA1722
MFTNRIMDAGSQTYSKLRLLPEFVDKSLLIKAVFDNANTRILLVAPRKSGKSVNLLMLKCFLEVVPSNTIMENNRALFKGLLINEHKEIMECHQGKYPILYLDLKAFCPISSITNALNQLALVVQGAYKQHDYLESSSELSDYEKTAFKMWCDLVDIPEPREGLIINSALINLANYLKKYWQKDVIILCDEYDSMCSNAVISIDNIPEGDALPPGRYYRSAEKEIREIIDICIGALSSIVKSEDVPVFRAILTGMSNLKTMGSSKLNNVIAYEFDIHDEFQPFYGLSKVELDSTSARNEKN